MAKILDLGAGENPYFLRYCIPWNIDDHYVYLDVDDKRLIKSKIKIEKFKEAKPLPGRMEFKSSDSIKLPFKDKEFDKIIVANFFTAPIHKNWDEERHLFEISNLSGFFRRPLIKSPDKLDFFYNERNQSLKEALRVLKVGGEMHIYTDLIIYGIASYEKLLHELKNNSHLKFVTMAKEQERVDKLNIKKLKENKFCDCFRAETLPKSSVHKVIKLK